MLDQFIDHLFRTQYGKMVSILTRIFGLQNLELIEDAVQDTFITAMRSWEDNVPENPNAWLVQAAKNRVVDLFRKLKADGKRGRAIANGMVSYEIERLFSEEEINDSVLRMIFTACHPTLDPRDQISFALKTISGFTIHEISNSLLLKEDTVKKRLSRARSKIAKENLKFSIPPGGSLLQRLHRVQEVVYLIFNEGFHSNHKSSLIKEDLCGEAMRLSQLILTKKELQISSSYALMALMCFHAARLDSKLDKDGSILDITKQDRAKWNMSLVMYGNAFMNKAVELDEEFTAYHYEAAIASEHLRASKFEHTNWKKILHWYTCLYQLYPTSSTVLNMAIVGLQLEDLEYVETQLEKIDATSLEQRAYLYYATKGEYLERINKPDEAKLAFERAIKMTSNIAEHDYLVKKYRR